MFDNAPSERQSVKEVPALLEGQLQSHNLRQQNCAQRLLN